MRKEVVPFDIASQLRDLGFDEPCFGYKVENEHFSVQVKVTNGKLKKQADKYRQTYKGRLPDMVACPLWQQVFDWFRVNYNLLHTIDGVHSCEPFELDCRILNIENGTTYCLPYTGNDYEEAGLKCIERLIKICKTEEK